MRALVLDGVGFQHLAVRQVPTPRPGPRQLLARVEAAGICTSLIKLIEQGANHPFVYEWDISRHPLILGDEGSVTVVEVGRDLKREYAVGQRFVVQPAVEHPPILHRTRYRPSAQAVQKVAVGYTLAGHLAEYMLIAEEILAADCLLPLPNAAIPHAHAALSEPFSCVISAQQHHVHLSQESPAARRKPQLGLKPGGVTVIIGAGAMGRMHVDLAMTYRPRAILVTDMLETRLKRVERMFGSRARRLKITLSAVNAARSELKQRLEKSTDLLGADDVIVAAASPQAMQTGLELVGRGGVFNLFAGLKKVEQYVPLDTGAVHYREIVVTGSSGGSPWDVAHTLDLMAAGKIDAGAHIAKVGGLNHAVELIRQVQAQQIEGKAIVYPHRPLPQILSVRRWTAADERKHLDRRRK
jgi:L-iditol 2-dehydrogenase